jgi:hypothetical protein
MASAFSDVPAFPSIALKLNAALTPQVNWGTHHSHPLRLEAITAIPFWVKTRDGALARQTLAKCLKSSTSRASGSISTSSLCFKLHHQPILSQYYNYTFFYIDRAMSSTPARRSSEDGVTIRYPGL